MSGMSCIASNRIHLFSSWPIGSTMRRIISETMKISFNILNGQSAEEKKDILLAVRRVFESGHYILGPEVKKFEAAFAQYIGTKHSIGVANGLEALQISLMALGIGPGDEVITTSLSAVATALAIKAVGARVVFTDIDDFYNLNAQ